MGGISLDEKNLNPLFWVLKSTRYPLSSKTKSTFCIPRKKVIPTPGNKFDNEYVVQ